MTLNRTDQRDRDRRTAQSFAASKQDQEARRTLVVAPPTATDGAEDATITHPTDADERDTDAAPFVLGIAPDAYAAGAAEREFAGMTESGRLVKLMNATKSAVGITERLARAQAEYRQAEAREYRTAAGREAILAELEAPLRELEQEATATAREASAFVDAAERRGRAVASDLEHRSDLSGPEMATAAARLPFIKDDIARLRLPELAQQIRAAVTTNDYPALYVFSRYAADALSTPRPAAPGKIAFPVDWSSPEAVVLRQAIADATEALDARRTKSSAPAGLPASLQHSVTEATKAIDKLSQRLADRPGPPKPTFMVDGTRKIPWPA